MASPISTGDIVGEGNRLVSVKQTAAVCTKGDVIQGTTTGFQTAPASSNNVGPFMVCYKTSGASDATVDAVESGEVYVTAGGTIQAHQYVQCDSSTAGRVVVFAARTDYTSDTVGIKNAAIDWQRIVGIYMGHVDEGAPTSGTPTNASSTDVIRMLLIH